MDLKTARFGAIEIDPDAIITLTQPIIGFQEFRRYVILPGPAESVVKWLQSTDSGELAFLIMDPRLVIPEYKADVSGHELSELAVTDVSELDVYTLVVVPHDQTQIRTNLRAPILINPKQRLGKQVILDRSDYPIQFFLAQAQRAEQQPKEVVNARSDS